MSLRRAEGWEVGHFRLISLKVLRSGLKVGAIAIEERRMQRELVVPPIEEIGIFGE